MGLDMFLYAEKYVSGYDSDDNPDKQNYEALVKMFGMEKFVDKDTPRANVTFVVAYWRKANAIHKWFVDNVQDGIDECQRSYVEREKLEELLDICQKVLANKELAQELLPPQSGFFFGGTDVDDWYFYKLEYTVKQLKTALELKNVDFYYRASW